MICITILNWNGFQDTIECLNSLNRMNYSDYFVVVGDNGSTNESMIRIEEFCNKHSIKIDVVWDINCTDINLQKRQVVLLDLKENNGFSKGNNLIIKFSEKYNPDYYFLLNNDTVIEPSCISILSSFITQNKAYKVLIPRINYFYDSKVIWNCGGKLFWGFRKYYYAKKNESVVTKEVMDVSFVTGCALLVSSALVHNHKLLTEIFFFGEEDFEFSMRMKKQKVKMACVTSAIVYHKVSASKSNISNINTIHLHYLNRFVNMKNHMAKWEYRIWKFIYFPYIFQLLYRQGFSVKTSCKLLNTINTESSTLFEVPKCLFHQILNITN